MAQPIPFSHKHHVGDVGIDCRYCHTSVETSAFAGLPSTTICLTCHSQLFAKAAVLEPLRRSVATGQPIAWNRVHTLPDFVYFNHGIHVAKGVACGECHGRVDQMPLTWRTAPLEMEWCLDCHRDPAPHLHPKSEVFAMASRAGPTGPRRHSSSRRRTCRARAGSPIARPATAEPEPCRQRAPSPSDRIAATISAATNSRRRWRRA